MKNNIYIYGARVAKRERMGGGLDYTSYYIYRVCMVSEIYTSHGGFWVRICVVN